MYRQIVDPVTNIPSKHSIIRETSNDFIPIDVLNSDYLQFKKDIASGAVLNDGSGVALTAKQAADFVATLP